MSTNDENGMMKSFSVILAIVSYAVLSVVYIEAKFQNLEHQQVQLKNMIQNSWSYRDQLIFWDKLKQRNPEIKTPTIMKNE